MSFPFMRLPVELAREIINHATITTGQVLITQARNEVYRTACALALVSTSIRAITMPNLLRTVVLSSHDEVILFIQALEIQRYFAAVRSRLQLNYQKLIRRFWSSVFHQPIPETQLTEDIDYRPLHNILRKVGDVGFHFDSMHLLAEVLELNAPVRRLNRPPPTWRTTCITLAGDPRWVRLTSNSAGLGFLHNLTHLTVWGPVKRGSHLQTASASQRSSDYQVPDWVIRIPFKHMVNLTHFAHTLIDHTSTDLETIPIITYIRQPSKSASAKQTENGGLIIEKWIKSSDPLSYGDIRLLQHFDMSMPNCHSDISREAWGVAFDRAENTLWPMVSD